MRTIEMNQLANSLNPEQAAAATRARCTILHWCAPPSTTSGSTSSPGESQRMMTTPLPMLMAEWDGMSSTKSRLPKR